MPSPYRPSSLTPGCLFNPALLPLVLVATLTNSRDPFSPPLVNPPQPLRVIAPALVHRLAVHHSVGDAVVSSDRPAAVAAHPVHTTSFSSHPSRNLPIELSWPPLSSSPPNWHSSRKNQWAEALILLEPDSAPCPGRPIRVGRSHAHDQHRRPPNTRQLVFEPDVELPQHCLETVRSVAARQFCPKPPRPGLTGATSPSVACCCWCRPWHTFIVPCTGSSFCPLRSTDSCIAYRIKTGKSLQFSSH